MIISTEEKLIVGEVNHKSIYAMSPMATLNRPPRGVAGNASSSGELLKPSSIAFTPYNEQYGV